MAERLDGTVALVTGASSGIGMTTALELSSLGAAIALAARRTDRLEDLAAKIRADGGTATVITADVTEEEQAHRVVGQTVTELGRLDMLINNAGLMLLGPVQDAPTDEWRAMIDVNVLGLMYCARAALPHLISAAADSPRRVADMVNLSSVAGRVPRNGSAVYNLVKHGVVAFSDALRQEVTGRHVRVSVMEPGATVTELNSHNRPEVLAQINHRFSDVERLQAVDIAEAIGFVVTRPRHMIINEMMIRPTNQEG
ncbi:MAG: SDR family NAD(P)-dependent oxidoreductase [Actinomycetota bacterium]